MVLILEKEEYKKALGITKANYNPQFLVMTLTPANIEKTQEIIDTVNTLFKNNNNQDQVNIHKFGHDIKIIFQNSDNADEFCWVLESYAMEQSKTQLSQSTVPNKLETLAEQASILSVKDNDTSTTELRESIEVNTSNSPRFLDEYLADLGLELALFDIRRKEFMFICESQQDQNYKHTHINAIYQILMTSNIKCSLTANLSPEEKSRVKCITLSDASNCEVAKIIIQQYAETIHNNKRLENKRKDSSSGIRQIIQIPEYMMAIGVSEAVIDYTNYQLRFTMLLADEYQELINKLIHSKRLLIQDKAFKELDMIIKDDGNNCVISFKPEILPHMEKLAGFLNDYCNAKCSTPLVVPSGNTKSEPEEEKMIELDLSSEQKKALNIKMINYNSGILAILVDNPDVNFTKVCDNINFYIINDPELKGKINKPNYYPVNGIITFSGLGISILTRKIVIMAESIITQQQGLTTVSNGSFITQVTKEVESKPEKQLDIEKSELDTSDFFNPKLIITFKTKESRNKFEVLVTKGSIQSQKVTLNFDPKVLNKLVVTAQNPQRLKDFQTMVEKYQNQENEMQIV